MKLAKRVFIGLLVVAILVSSIAVAISADTAEPAYDDILKYYDPATSTIYVDEDFEGATYEGEFVNGADDKLSGRVELSVETDNNNNPTNKYMDMISGPITNTAAVGNMLYVVNINDENGDPAKLGTFVFDADIKASHIERAHLLCGDGCGYDDEFNSFANLPEVCPRCGAAVNVKKSGSPLVKVFVGETPHMDGSITGTALIVLDFARGKVLLNVGSSFTELDMAISENKWYSVHIVYEQNKFELIIADVANKDNKLTYRDISTPMHSVASVKVGYDSTSTFDGRDTVISLDNIYLQSGSDYRKTTPEELEALTKASIAQLKGMLFDDTVSLSTKFKVVDVYDKLLDVYGYTTTDAEVLSDIEAIKAQILVVYGESLKNTVSSINVRDSYEERFAHIETGKVVAERVRTYMSGDVADDIKNALSVYDAEVADLADDKVASEAFMAFVQEWFDDGYDFSSNDYKVLAEFYDAAKAAFYDEDKQSYKYNTTYPGISDAFNNHDLVRSKFEKMKSQSEAFVDAINELKDAVDAYADAKTAYDAVDPADTAALEAAAAQLSLAQADRLVAYAESKVLVYDNETCPGVTDALEFYEAQTELKAIGEVAENFLGFMAKATVAINLDTKEKYLDDAELLLDEVAIEYPGVAEAKEQYVTIRQSIADVRKAAADYIAAVAALDGLTGDELVAAVNNALALKEAGDILEIDGVIDANIALFDIYTSLRYAEASATKFVTLVGNIDNTASLATRFAAIKLANDARNVPDKTLSGVSEAEAVLNDAIALYDSDISEINASYAESTKNAADLSGAPITLEGVGAYVISFIKSLIS